MGSIICIESNCQCQDGWVETETIDNTIANQEIFGEYAGSESLIEDDFDFLSDCCKSPAGEYRRVSKVKFSEDVQMSRIIYNHPV